MTVIKSPTKVRTARRLKNTRKKGTILEKATLKEIKEMLDIIPKIKYYCCESKGSRTIADLIFIVTNSNSGNQTVFGVQCKSGNSSPAEIKKERLKAKKEFGIDLIWATIDNDNSIVYTPCIKSYLKSEVVNG